MLPFKRKKYQKLEDLELIEKIDSGNENVILGVFYERYAHLVMGVALKYVKRQEEAEDLTMHVFEHLIERIKKNTIQNFSSWLYVVVKNECYMYFRRSKKMLPAALTEMESIAEEEEFDFIFQEKQIGLLEKCLAMLKTEQRNCLTLFYIEGKNYQAISDELAIPLLKVKSAIQNGKRNLKIVLEKQDEFQS